MFGTMEYFFEFMSKERHLRLINKLEVLKQGYEESLKSLSAEEAFNGSEWSVRDLLAHSTGGFYQTMTRRILTEDTPDFGNRVFDIEKTWQRILKQSINDVTEAYETAKNLTEKQMNRTGIWNEKTKNPMDLLESWADHLEEHFLQLRDEVIPREQN
jgi:hypothetical protein